jgi:SAM-dependent methyltransferase
MLSEPEKPSDSVVPSAPTEWPSFSSEWFKEAFKDDYRLLYAARTARQARIEVDRIVTELAISSRDRVLDLCCGHGRHLEAFRRLGIPTTGVDLSMQLLAAHERRCADEESADGESDTAAASQTPLVRADMRALPFSECFDVVVNFFTSFGYFEAEEDHAVAAQALAEALRPGGRFSMDLMNPETAIRSLNPRSERRVEPFDIVERRRYDAQKRRIEKHTHLRYRPSGGTSGGPLDGPLDGPSRIDGLDGRSRSYHESVRIFSRPEITALLHGADLEVERVLGDFSGAPHDAASPRLIVLGRKPGT